MLKDNRMAAICGMVRDGAVVCDVGSDHALIPAELLKSGKCKRAIITDISAPSLEKGIKNIKKEGLSDKVSAFLADGTLGAEISGVTDVIVAGMGGELISEILGRDERLKRQGLRFILQPMSRAHKLREYLLENGFEIVREVKAAVERRVYAVINAEYTGKRIKPILRDIYLGAGADAGNENDRKYAEKELCALKVKLDGIEGSGSPEKHISEREYVLRVIEEIIGFLGT